MVPINPTHCAPQLMHTSVPLLFSVPFLASSQISFLSPRSSALSPNCSHMAQHYAKTAHRHITAHHARPLCQLSLTPTLMLTHTEHLAPNHPGCVRECHNVLLRWVSVGSSGNCHRTRELLSTQMFLTVFVKRLPEAVRRVCVLSYTWVPHWAIQWVHTESWVIQLYMSYTLSIHELYTELWVIHWVIHWVMSYTLRYELYTELWVIHWVIHWVVSYTLSYELNTELYMSYTLSYTWVIHEIYTELWVIHKVIHELYTTLYMSYTPSYTLSYELYTKLYTEIDTELWVIHELYTKLYTELWVIHQVIHSAYWFILKLYFDITLQRNTACFAVCIGLVPSLLLSCDSCPWTGPLPSHLCLHPAFTPGLPLPTYLVLTPLPRSNVLSVVSTYTEAHTGTPYVRT